MERHITRCVAGGTAVLALTLLAACGGGAPASSGGSTPAAASAPASTPPSGAPPAAASNWQYEEQADAMHDTKTQFACAESQNEVNLSAPYSNTKAKLCIRKGPKGLDAYIQLDGDGQILCEIEGCSVPVRFDKASIKKFPAVSAEDNSSNIIFINRTKDLVSSLKTASQTVVELTFYQAGNQQLIFDTKDLKWD